jgi:hypothetical protein
MINEFAFLQLTKCYLLATTALTWSDVTLLGSGSRATLIVTA